ncbi:NAD(P)/FAD-dependent oxidoreductase [Patulibacter sp. SYSU D01012]|uniref:NAD(P)/FAD-dependent oxidoreductase n=1 Tax=Patulibacter sp. SYSU D01012 TaxID=2817381 RepID=UPI001B3188C0|nr:NAD(P)/FAD-dependent oxidoreductase [Patulibacter sp. SYSU D01012]
MDNDFDCIVVGGGAAGLSAALVLGRARKRTLVVDAGRQSNRVAHGIGGLLGHDGRPPAGLYAAGREELARYPAVTLRAGEVVDGERRDGRFRLTLADGARVAGRRVLLATGMDYAVPDLPGAAERWGGAVFHCPFCHGWEVRDRPLAVLERGPHAATRALLLRGWSSDVALLTDGPADVTAEDAARLAAAGVAVDERPVAALEGHGTALAAVRFADGSARPCEGLMVGARLSPRSDLAVRLGAELAEPTPMATGAVRTAAGGATSVPGLFAAGDGGGDMPTVAVAIAAGSLAAASVVHDLLPEDHPVPAEVAR